jgi:SsrA-binding protein
VAEKGKIVANNRKARHDYHILERFEAGIVLRGTEVKSLRSGMANLNDAFASVEHGEVILQNVHIAPYVQGNRWNLPERRPRKLLLHQSEIKRLIGAVTRKGFTIIPLKMYFNEKGIAKVEIALARGKKIIDRREDIKARDIERETRREQKIR